MPSPSNPCEQSPGRHALVFVSQRCWRRLLAARSDLQADPLVRHWVANGWPLVRRRPRAGEAPGVPLGLALPPFAGKRRLSVLVQPEDVAATTPPLPLRSARRAAPQAWQPTLDRLQGLALRHRLEPAVFGSLAWQAITGLPYLTAGSDLDLLLPVRRETSLGRLAADLAEIEASAPMALDGEFIRNDGAAVNWREIQSGAQEILVKTLGGVSLIEAPAYLPGSAAP